MAKFTVTYEFEDSTGYYPVPTQQFKFVSGEHIEDQHLGETVQNISDDLRTILLNCLDQKTIDISRGFSTKHIDGLIKVLRTLQLKSVEVAPAEGDIVEKQLWK